MPPDFLIEDEYTLYYIKILCGMCGMVFWDVMCLNFFLVVAVTSCYNVFQQKQKVTQIVNKDVPHVTNISQLHLTCHDTFKQNRRSKK